MGVVAIIILVACTFYCGSCDLYLVNAFSQNIGKINEPKNVLGVKLSGKIMAPVRPP